MLAFKPWMSMAPQLQDSFFLLLERPWWYFGKESFAYVFELRDMYSMKGKTSCLDQHQTLWPVYTLSLSWYLGARGANDLIIGCRTDGQTRFFQHVVLERVIKSPLFSLLTILESSSTCLPRPVLHVFLTCRYTVEQECTYWMFTIGCHCYLLSLSFFITAHKPISNHNCYQNSIKWNHAGKSVLVFAPCISQGQAMWPV